MANLHLLGLIGALSLTAALVGCGGADASPQPASNATEEDLTKGGPLSQSLVCAALSAADGDPEGNSWNSVDEKRLKGDALADFKAFQRGFGGEFPSHAFELPVTLGKKTYTFWYILEVNDGGGCSGIYRTDGRLVTNECAGESGNIEWSAPADKCGQ